MSNIKRYEMAKAALAELDQCFITAFNDGGCGIRLVTSSPDCDILLFQTGMAGPVGTREFRSYLLRAINQDMRRLAVSAIKIAELDMEAARRIAADEAAK